VLEAFPASQALTPLPDTDIVVTFDRPVDPATVDASSFLVFGRWSGVAQGVFAFEDAGRRVRFTPGRAFSAGERVTVSLDRQVRSAAGTAIAHGYTWQFMIRPAPAGLALTEVARVSVRTSPLEGHIQTYGAYAGDFDEDGFSDLAVPNEVANDVRVFLNDGAGRYRTFTAYPVPKGARPSANEGADFNRDGHIDFALGNTQNNQLSVFLGTGNGTFGPIQNYETDTQVRGVTVLDLDGDGFSDIATANRTGQGHGTVTLLMNDGTGAFGPDSTFDGQGQNETAIEAADANGDGILDLFVGALDSQEILLLLGDGAGGVSFHTRGAAGGNPWMIATGDVNGDGHVDVVSANSSASNAAVILGDGQGGLTEAVTYPTGDFPLAIDLGDLDGDGDLDLVTSNFSGRNWTIYENAGDGTFGNPRTLAAAVAGSCAVLHDRDGDGTLDMTGIDEFADMLFLFENTAAPTNVQEHPATVLDFQLDFQPPFPNPFVTSTSIHYLLPERTRVHASVYDLLGRRVRVLLDDAQPPGRHTLTWDGLDAAGRSVPAGLYVYRLATGRAVLSAKVFRL
jgi:hypothetical protein